MRRKDRKMLNIVPLFRNFVRCELHYFVFSSLHLFLWLQWMWVDDMCPSFGGVSEVGTLVSVDRCVGSLPLIQLCTHRHWRGLQWARVVWQVLPLLSIFISCGYPGILLADTESNHILTRVRRFHQLGALWSFGTGLEGKYWSATWMHLVCQVWIPL